MCQYSSQGDKPHIFDTAKVPAITSEQLPSLIQSDEVVVVYFFGHASERSGLCREILLSVIPEIKNAKVFVYHLDKNDTEVLNSLISFPIRALPTMIFFKRGKEVERFVMSSEYLDRIQHAIDRLNMG